MGFALQSLTQYRANPDFVEWSKTQDPEGLLAIVCGKAIAKVSHVKLMLLQALSSVILSLLTYLHHQEN